MADANQTTEQTAGSARSYTDAVAAMRHGELLEEATDKLIELTEKCMATGKAGSITLTLTLKPSRKGAHVEVFDELTVKPPKEEKGSSVMFVTTQYRLTRNDPRQPELPGIRVVPVVSNEPVRIVGREG